MTANIQNGSSLPIFRAREKNPLHFELPVFSFSQDVQWDLVGFCANLVKKYKIMTAKYLNDILKKLFQNMKKMCRYCFVS